MDQELCDWLLDERKRLEDNAKSFTDQGYVNGQIDLITQILDLFAFDV